MIGALLITLLAVGAVFWGGSPPKGQKKPRNLPVAVIGAIVAGVTLLIAFPSLLAFGGSKMSPVALGLVAAVGIICLLMAGNEKTPTPVMLVLGATLVLWAFFRWLPTGPAAFQFLGLHVSAAGNELWVGVKGFFKILGNSKALQKLPGR